VSCGESKKNKYWFFFQQMEVVEWQKSRLIRKNAQAVASASLFALEAFSSSMMKEKAIQSVLMTVRSVVLA
jgi:hypothetical protein